MAGYWIISLTLAFINLLVTGVHSDTGCRDGDQRHGANRCLMVIWTPVTYDGALDACESRGSRLINPITYDQDTDDLVQTFGQRVKGLSFWGEFLFVKGLGDYKMFDSRGLEIKSGSCPQCHSLEEQTKQLYQLSERRACTRVSTNDTLSWNITDCTEKHYAICQYVTDPPVTGLKAGDIAAIVSGTFILLCFGITLVIDFYLHLKKQQRKYFESNLNVKNVINVKTLTDGEPQTPTSTGSKVELLSPNWTLSHV